jgi:hypothetical protein
VSRASPTAPAASTLRYPAPAPNPSRTYPSPTRRPQDIVEEEHGERDAGHPGQSGMRTRNAAVNLLAPSGEPCQRSPSRYSYAEASSGIHSMSRTQL